MIDSTLKHSNILIVDDQEANTDVLTGLLEMQGYLNIKTCNDSREVMPLIESFNPDLILLDLMMPYFSGFEVMDQIRKTLPEHTFLPILVLTADVTIDTKKRALSGGASDFLCKPFDLVEVGLRIRNLLWSSYLQQQLQNQNQLLEEKVKERTAELEKQTIELIAAKEKAEASDRLKTSFLNNVSHEIRTPLNGILGFGQILTDPDLSAHQKKKYVEMLNESSERLVHTVTNFLDISLLNSNNQEINLNEIDPAAIIKDAVSRFRNACISKKLILSVQLPPLPNGYKVLTDKDLLDKIFFQLIDNAVKFTNHGAIRVGYEIHHDEVHFFVKDTGIGISEISKTLIFENFIQEDNSITRGYGGSGLGLSIAKGFVEILGGRIWLVTEKDKGSTFYFSLPNSQQTVPGQRTEPIQKAEEDSRKYTILIAEDDDINFSYISIVLKHKLNVLIRAKNGIEAVEICKQHPEIDLVLMDLKMPVMNGFEATKEIKSLRDDLPVIAITAYSGNEGKLRAIQAGCDDFISKPLKKDTMLEKMKNLNIKIHI